MADKLQEHLVNIETALGGTGELPSDDSDKLEWHLTKIESLIEGGSSSSIEDVKVNDTSVVEDKVANIKLKTINDNEITGEGNIAIESGTQVVANPTLEGDESALSGLEVAGTKYKVGGSSSPELWEHDCEVVFSDPSGNYRVIGYLKVLADSDYYDMKSLCTYLYSKGITGQYSGITMYLANDFHNNDLTFPASEDSFVWTDGVSLHVKAILVRLVNGVFTSVFTGELVGRNLNVHKKRRLL